MQFLSLLIGSAGNRQHKFQLFQFQYIHTKEYSAVITRNRGCSKCSNMEVQKLKCAKQCLKSVLSCLCFYRHKCKYLCTHKNDSRHTHPTNVLWCWLQEGKIRCLWMGQQTHVSLCNFLYLSNFVLYLYWKLLKWLSWSISKYIKEGWRLRHCFCSQGI